MIGQCIGNTKASSTDESEIRLVTRKDMASLDSLMLALAAAASPLMDMGRSMAKAPEELPAQPRAVTTGGDGDKKVPKQTQKVEDTKATAPATESSASEPMKRKSMKTKEEKEPSAKKAR